MSGQPNQQPRIESLDNIDLSMLFNANDEFHSVDDFFNSYVAELTNRSKRSGGELSTDPISKQLRLAPPNLPFNSLNPNGDELDQLSLGLSDLQRSAPPVAPSPFLASGVTPELLQQAGLLALQQNQQQQKAKLGFAAAMPTVGAQQTAPKVGPVHAPVGSGAGEHVSPASTYSGEIDNANRNSHGRGSKSARQQEANKIAQQRYREKKKQKFVEMEKQVELLRVELERLQSVAARNQILEGMNNELQKALVDREREVERLKVELDTHADASLGAASEDSEGAAGGLTSARRSGGASTGAGGAGGAANQAAPFQFHDAPGFTGAGGATVPCDMLPRDLTGIDFESGFAAQIENLKTYLKKHNLEDLNTVASDVPPTVMGELANLVGTSCQLCQAAIRAEGARVLELIAGDPSQLSSAEHPAQDRFNKALDVMQMTPEQQEQLLFLRRSHLEKMREIYAERQSLNLEAMALMLPHHSRNPAEDNTVEGKMENISNFGYLPVAKSNAALASVLDCIKDNLRREQRSAMDINCATVSKVLTPLQAAHYMVAVYPQHCDALALSNVLAHRLGREDPAHFGGDGGAYGNSSRGNSTQLPAAGCCGLAVPKC